MFFYPIANFEKKYPLALTAFVAKLYQVVKHEEIVICKYFFSQNVNIFLHLSNPHDVLKVLRTVKLKMTYASEKVLVR